MIKFLKKYLPLKVFMIVFCVQSLIFIPSALASSINLCKANPSCAAALVDTVKTSAAASSSAIVPASKGAIVKVAGGGEVIDITAKTITAASANGAKPKILAFAAGAGAGLTIKPSLKVDIENVQNNAYNYYCSNNPSTVFCGTQVFKYYSTVYSVERTMTNILSFSFDPDFDYLCSSNGGFYIKIEYSPGLYDGVCGHSPRFEFTNRVDWNNLDQSSRDTVINNYFGDINNHSSIIDTAYSSEEEIYNHNDYESNPDYGIYPSFDVSFSPEVTGDFDIVYINPEGTLVNVSPEVSVNFTNNNHDTDIDNDGLENNNDPYPTNPDGDGDGMNDLDDPYPTSPDNGNNNWDNPPPPVIDDYDPPVPEPSPTPTPDLSTGDPSPPNPFVPQSDCPIFEHRQQIFLGYFLTEASDRFPLDVIGSFPSSSAVSPAIAFYGRNFSLDWFFDALDYLKIPTWLSFLVWSIINL